MVQSTLSSSLGYAYFELIWVDRDDPLGDHSRISQMQANIGRAIEKDSNDDLSDPGGKRNARAKRNSVDVEGHP